MGSGERDAYCGLDGPAYGEDLLCGGGLYEDCELWGGSGAFIYFGFLWGMCPDELVYIDDMHLGL